MKPPLTYQQCTSYVLRTKAASPHLTTPPIDIQIRTRALPTSDGTRRFQCGCFTGEISASPNRAIAHQRCSGRKNVHKKTRPWHAPLCKTTKAQKPQNSCLHYNDICHRHQNVETY